MAGPTSERTKVKISLSQRRAALRARYETDDDISLRELARITGTSESSIFRMAAREKWKKRCEEAKLLVQQSVNNLEARVEEKARQMVENELAPWIEKQKTRITKRGFAIGDRGLSRIEKLWRNDKNPSDAKNEADAARAAETHLRMARVSLGMDDGKPSVGVLNMAILTGQAAVQINPPASQ